MKQVDSNQIKKVIVGFINGARDCFISMIQSSKDAKNVIQECKT